MGVDVGVKFRMLDEQENVKLEVEVTAQDNSLGSVLTIESEIQYTSLSLRDENYLNTKEIEKIKLHYDEANEMEMISKISDIDDILKIFNKINSFTYNRLSLSLANDIEKLGETEYEPEDKAKRIRSKIGDYNDFKFSLGASIGILQLASKLYPKVQIVGEYY
jgi:hypothetical protein